MKTEHLRIWMEEQNMSLLEQDELKIKAWKIVTRMIINIFNGKDIPKSFGLGILVLIPKGVPDQCRGIALLEVIIN